MTKIDLSKIFTLAEFAPIFSISEEQFNHFIQEKDNLIKDGIVLKKSGDFRKISIIQDDPFKHFIKKLADFLYDRSISTIPDTVHGFMKGKSIITNAQNHTKKLIVLNLDIARFFPSITIEKIRNIFLALGFKSQIATPLSNLVTVNNVLATGFSTSPILSNIICTSMDKDLESLAKKYQAVYSRYVDDITFSSNQNTPTRCEITKILETYGFSINPIKHRIYRRGGPQYVTGLTVVDSRPRLSKRLKRSIRLELYYINKHGFTNHLIQVMNREAHKEKGYSRLGYIFWNGYGLKGYASFINSIEPHIAKRILETELSAKL